MLDKFTIIKNKKSKIIKIIDKITDICYFSMN